MISYNQSPFENTDPVEEEDDESPSLRGLAQLKAKLRIEAWNTVQKMNVHHSATTHAPIITHPHLPPASPHDEAWTLACKSSASTSSIPTHVLLEANDEEKRELIKQTGVSIVIVEIRGKVLSLLPWCEEGPAFFTPDTFRKPQALPLGAIQAICQHTEKEIAQAEVPLSLEIWEINAFYAILGMVAHHGEILRRYVKKLEQHGT